MWYNCSYFTLKIILWDPYVLPVNVTIRLLFLKLLEVQDLFINSNETLHIHIDYVRPPPAKILYLRTNKPLYLNLTLESKGNLMSLEIFRGIIPLTLQTKWWEKYTMIYRDPPVTLGLGKLNPQLYNLFIPPGEYSIVIIYWGKEVKAVEAVLRVLIIKLS